MYCQAGYRRHLQHGQETVQQIFGIEAGEVKGVPDPGPPDRDENLRETAEHGG